jgi:purine-cytosine permease-like protein
MWGIMKSRIAALASQMDQLQEFEREPVSPSHFQTARQFAGLFAGEHVAATEFVIGAFFVLHGVSLRDLLVGLGIGNLLAVLSWTFICAPIATRTRLTLYWYLRRIGGPAFMGVYNVLNGALYCVLAGAMISVSATAVSSLIGLPSPGLNDVFPNSVGWALIALCIGAAFTIMAILGFEKFSRFAVVCSPWLFVVFVACAIAVLPALGVRSDFSNLWEVAATRIWNGHASAGQEKFGVAHVMFFAWFANLAMHVALSDMALFRFAPHWKYGLLSAFGMYPGHMLAWICSGIMVAGINREMNPGLMAIQAGGVAGGAAVMIAGWTTANPTLYRSGLAFQAITPNWPRWKTTALAGTVTTLLACMPVFFMRLLDYVAIYGLALMPVGAIVFAEHWIFPRLGIEQYTAERRGWTINWAALGVWAATLIFCYLLPIHLYFKWLPGYFFALVTYTVVSGLTRRAPALTYSKGARA